MNCPAQVFYTNITAIVPLPIVSANAALDFRQGATPVNQTSYLEKTSPVVGVAEE